MDPRICREQIPQGCPSLVHPLTTSRCRDVFRTQRSLSSPLFSCPQGERESAFYSFHPSFIDLKRTNLLCPGLLQVAAGGRNGEFPAKVSDLLIPELPTYPMSQRAPKPRVRGAGPTATQKSWVSQALWTTGIINCTRHQEPKRLFVKMKLKISKKSARGNKSKRAL